MNCQYCLMPQRQSKSTRNHYCIFFYKPLIPPFSCVNRASTRKERRLEVIRAETCNHHPHSARPLCESNHLTRTPCSLSQVAVKMNAVVEDPRQELQNEAELHFQAWIRLPHVVRPLGFLPAHAPTGFPAVLVMELVT